MNATLTATLILATALTDSGGAGAEDRRPPFEIRTLAADGAWCWFADPRAVHRGGRTFAGWVTSTGDIVVASIHHGTDAIETHVLREHLQRDDHDNPALLLLGDGRLLVFYCEHNGRSMLSRRSSRPLDVTAWEPERTLTFGIPGDGPRGTSFTYPNPVLLAGENDRIYLFWRGLEWKPTFSTSDDGGESWSRARILFKEPGADSGNRPYAKIASDGARRIHFALTDGHPRNEVENGIHYGYYESGAIHRADGTRLADLASLPVPLSKLDLVYDGTDESPDGGRAWIWDVAGAADGRPVIAYTRHPSETDHRYRYAHWDGKRWRDQLIAAGGRGFPQTPEGKREPEPHYSGGVVLDPGDPRVVFLSRPYAGSFEMERHVSTDGGSTWTVTPLTRGSGVSHVRPVVVRNHGADGPRVLWMTLRGHYVHYTDYQTSISMALPRPRKETDR